MNTDIKNRELLKLISYQRYEQFINLLQYDPVFLF